MLTEAKARRLDTLKKALVEDEGQLAYHFRYLSAIHRRILSEQKGIAALEAKQKEANHAN